MKAVDVKTLYRNTIDVALPVGKDSVKITVDTFPSTEKTTQFMQTVVNYVYLTDGYHPERVHVAIDWATLATYTDFAIDGTPTWDDAACFIYATDAGTMVRDALREHMNGQRTYLDDAADGAYRYIDYYRQMIAPQSATDKVLESLDGVLNDMRDALHMIMSSAEMMAQAQLSPEELQAAVQGLKNMDAKELVDALAGTVNKD